MSKANNSSFSVSVLQLHEMDELAAYLEALSPETRKRFSPHPFNIQSIIEFYRTDTKYTGYIAREPGSGIITGYAVVSAGFFEHDRPRLESYELNPDQQTDCQFAPSVADAWQHKGIGRLLLQFVIADQEAKGVRRICLWGGVQKDNENAVNYYLKNGFRILGEFSWHGANYDMVLDLHKTLNTYP